MSTLRLMPRRAYVPRRARRSALVLCALVAGALGAASPAGAVVTTINGQSFGIAPRTTAAYTGSNLTRLDYHGGPVMHASSTYAIYWDPQGGYDGDWKSLINGYLGDVAHDSGTLGNVFAVNSQYTDGSGRAAYSSTFRGAYTDYTAYPSTGGCADSGRFCLTDAQLRNELNRFISAHGLQTGMSTMFFLLTPPGVTVCADAGGSGGHCSDATSANSLCGYHSAIGSGDSSTVVYAVQPWTAGSSGMYDADQFTGSDSTACQDGFSLQEPNQMATLDLDGDADRALPDVVINQLSIQHNSAMMNPLLNGWYASGTGNEGADQCRNWLEPTLGGSAKAQPFTGAGTLFDQRINGHNYYMNTEFNNAALDSGFPGVPCIPGVSMVAHFTPPSTVNVGDIVGLDGSESTVTLGAVNYHWDLGDGQNSTSSQGSVYHTYTQPGTYNISLAVTDRGGNTNTNVQQILVVAPTPVAPPTSNGGTSGIPGVTGVGGGLGTGGPTGSQPGPGVVSAGGPKMSDSILSTSLKKALNGGLAVRYTVNEEVAGRFEVMLDGRAAHRLGVHGAVAAGFSHMSNARRPLVVGTAMIVTSRGATDQLSIRFDKGVAKHLRHAHSLSITLRLTVVDLAGKRSVLTRAAVLRG